MIFSKSGMKKSLLQVTPSFKLHPVHYSVRFKIIRLYPKTQFSGNSTHHQKLVSLATHIDLIDHMLNYLPKSESLYTTTYVSASFELQNKISNQVDSYLIPLNIFHHPLIVFSLGIELEVDSQLAPMKIGWLGRFFSNDSQVA